MTNSIYGAWDPIFYPEGWAPGRPSWTPTRRPAGWPPTRFFPNGDAFRGLRVHQTRLQAGDASSDSYCFHELIEPRPLAHHLGEDSLVNLLLVGGAGLSLMVVKAAPGWRPPGPN